jgi:hypothetical protein
MPPLFEAPAAHELVPDRWYERQLLSLDPGRPALFAQEESDREHLAGSRSQYERARAHFKNRLRARWARALGVGPGGQVHHRIELQALTRFPGVFTPRELNALRNMSGIPGEMDPATFERRRRELQADLRRRAVEPGSADWRRTVAAQRAELGHRDLPRRMFHNGLIRRFWNAQYTELDRQLRLRGLRDGTPAHAAFVRAWLERGARGVDALYPGRTTEERRRLDWRAMSQGLDDARTIDLVRR